MPKITIYCYQKSPKKAEIDNIREINFGFWKQTIISFEYLMILGQKLNFDKSMSKFQNRIDTF